MGKNPERRLVERLARVEALHRGATTPGEREAAAKARDRVVKRIVEERAKDPVAIFCAAHVASLGVPDRPPRERPRRLPTQRTMAMNLRRWERGDWTRDRIRRWAMRIVDAVFLPTDPHQEGACRGEVLLQLSMLHRIELRPTDVTEILRFLDERDWEGWFTLLAEAAGR